MAKILRQICWETKIVHRLVSGMIAVLLFASVFPIVPAYAQTPPSADPFAHQTPVNQSQTGTSQTPVQQVPGSSTPANTPGSAQDGSFPSTAEPSGQTLPPSETNADTTGQPAGSATQEPVAPPAKKVVATPSSGKQQIAIQLPAPRLLMQYLRIGQETAIARIKSITKGANARFAQAGLDPNISVDDAMNQGKLVFMIYFAKSQGLNILSHGFKLKATLCQYYRKPSGAVAVARYSNVGESPEVYSSADLENKALMLVDVYLYARQSRLKEANKAKPAAKKKRGK